MAMSKAWHAVLGDFTAFQTSSLGLQCQLKSQPNRWLLQAVSKGKVNDMLYYYIYR